MASGNAIDVERGIAYGSGGALDLELDIYRPSISASAGVGIVFLRSRASDAPDLHVLAHLAAQRGHTGIVVPYRVGFRNEGGRFVPFPEEVWPAPIHDIKAAVRWARAHASELGISPTSIALFGGSNAGMFALAAAGTAERAELEGDGGNRECSSRVDAVIAASAPTRLSDWGIALIAGAGASRDTIDQISPITYAAPGFPPTLLMHGASDSVIKPSESENLYRALNAASVPVELHLYAGQNHGFASQPAFINHTAELTSLFVTRYLRT